MKTYRLIKAYPGSPKLGTILTHEELQYCNWNEYYQEVVEKDYEILSFKTVTNKILKKYSQINRFCEKNGNSPFYYENDLLNSVVCSIHSIKRKDGEIFTIGDKVQDSLTDELTNFKVQTITYFYPGDKIICQAESGTTMPLTTIRKVETPLFTTEDGVDIFEGSTYWWVNTNFWKAQKEKITNSREHNAQETGYNVGGNFSTKEKAEEYILMNKPVLSLKEIKETTTIKGLSLKKLEKLVQQKLNK